MEAEVEALAGLDLAGLRSRWQALYGNPPETRSPEILALMLAWRMQAAVQGGLDVAVRRDLRRPGKAKAQVTLTPGTCLTREWQGVRHDVVVETAGFRHEGEVHRSLSQVARKIAGSRWNGPRFFGLRAEEAA